MINFNKGSYYSKIESVSTNDIIVISQNSKNEIDIVKKSLEEELFGTVSPTHDTIDAPFIEYLEKIKSPPTPKLNDVVLKSDYQRSDLDKASSYGDDTLVKGTIQHDFYCKYLKNIHQSRAEHLEMKKSFIDMVSFKQVYAEVEKTHSAWANKLKSLELSGEKIINQNKNSVENAARGLNQQVEALKNFKTNNEKIMSKHLECMSKISQRYDKLNTDLNTFEKQYLKFKPINGCARCPLHCLHITKRDFKAPSGRPSAPPMKKSRKNVIFHIFIYIYIYIVLILYIIIYYYLYILYIIFIYIIIM